MQYGDVKPELTSKEVSASVRDATMLGGGALRSLVGQNVMPDAFTVIVIVAVIIVMGGAGFLILRQGN